MKTNQKKYHEDLILSLDIIIAALCFGFDFHLWVKALAVANAVAQFAYTCVIWYKAEKIKRKGDGAELAALREDNARLEWLMDMSIPVNLRLKNQPPKTVFLNTRAGIDAARMEDGK